jgi:hypothetical protein
MSLLAKSIIKNKCWIVEEDGTKVATIIASPTGVTYVHNEVRENFASFKMLSDRYNIVLDSSKLQKPINLSYEVYGYQCSSRPYNTLWNVQKKLPIYTTDEKSKCYYCAGYYIVNLDNLWTKAYCPKLITLNRYPFNGPFKTKEEMMLQLQQINGDQ